LCVQDLDGMFAFVVTDGERFLAARDPLGIKPLYVGWGEATGVWFASELKSLPTTCRDIAELRPVLS
jgi:asparagine synthase (glutamine-hydrolysing)